jgi:predicted lipoprotein with Yx(FWY)xxD motif
MNRMLRIGVPGAVAGLLCGAIACGGSYGSPAQAGPALKLGRSLYQIFQDTTRTASSDPVSAGTVRCLVTWPIFLSEAAVVPSGLAASDFTVFTRLDGQRQSAYKGRPLYFFAGDAAPGETTGRGVANRDTVNPRNIP